MKLSVNSQAIEITDYEMTVSGSSGIYEVEFTFTSDWDEYAKTAEFRNGSTVVQALISSNKATIPYAALSPGGTFEIGVYGSKTVSSVTYKKPTVWTPPIFINEGCVIGTAVPDPSQSVYDEIMEACEEAVSTAEAVEDRADSGEFVPVFTVNSTTTGAAGTSASVTVTSTDVYHPKFDFTIPRGDTGSTGPKGDTGEKGDTGVSISSISKTSTSGLVDTYTVTFTNGNTTTFNVTNGAKGDTGDDAEILLTEYQESTSGTVTPSGTWTTTIPSVTDGNFLWMRFTWNNGSYSYMVTKFGENGEMALADYDASEAVKNAGGIVAYQEAHTVALDTSTEGKVAMGIDSTGYYIRFEE